MAFSFLSRRLFAPGFRAALRARPLYFLRGEEGKEEERRKGKKKEERKKGEEREIGERREEKKKGERGKREKN